MTTAPPKINYGGYPTPSEARKDPRKETSVPQPWKYEKAKNEVALPTIGRVIYLYDNAMTGVDRPYLGMVADVIGGHTINAVAFSHDGDLIVGGLQNVPHDSDKAPDAKVWWDWMPYQKGQAAKTEELQRELDAKSNPAASSK